MVVYTTMLDTLFCLQDQLGFRHLEQVLMQQKALVVRVVVVAELVRQAVLVARARPVLVVALEVREIVILILVFIVVVALAALEALEEQVLEEAAEVVVDPVLAKQNMVFMVVPMAPRVELEEHTAYLFGDCLWAPLVPLVAADQQTGMVVLPADLVVEVAEAVAS
jgi:hypothetical protein